MKNTPDYKSRFRILKGGRISLVVSALLVSVSISTPAFGIDFTIDDTNTTQQDLNASTSDTLTIDSNGTLDVRGLYVPAVVVTESGSVSIINNGLIENNATTHYDSIAIAAESGINRNTLTDSYIVNTGTINISNASSESDRSLAIYLEYINNTQIINTGSIIVEGLNSESFGIKVDNMYENSIIKNDLNITVTATGNDATGIQASSMNEDDGYGFESSIVNTGIIDVNAYRDATGIEVSEMYYSSSIENNGTINATSSASDAYGFIIHEMDNNASVVNNGTINATSLANDAYGIKVESMYDNASVVNNGTINATGNDATGIHVSIMNEDDGYGSESSIVNTANGIIDVNASGVAIGIEVSEMYYSSSIENNGTINATSSTDKAFGIDVEYMYDNASVVNNGTINVTANNVASGFYLSDDINENALFENNGTINVTANNVAYGFDLKGNMEVNASIVNTQNGVIDVNSTGEAARGISVINMNDAATITNEGLIDVTSGSNEGSFDATGIYARSMNANTIISNSGTIITLQTADYGSRDTHGIHIGTIMEGNASIVNTSTGNITSTFSSRDAFGIVVNGDMNDTSSIQNAGTITITNAARRAVGISASTHMLDNSYIQNSGNITLTNVGENSYGIRVATMDDNSSISNSGTMTITATDSSTGIYAAEAYANVSVTNELGANIVATSEGFAVGIDMGNGDGDENTAITNNGTIITKGNYASVGILSDGDANITNSGTITASSTSGELFDYGFSVYAHSYIHNTSTGIMNGNIIGRTVTNDGRINLANAAAHIDTFSQSATGTLGIILDYEDDGEGNSGFTNSTIAVTDATIEDGSNFYIDVKAAAEAQAGSLESITVITADEDGGSLSVDSTTQNVTDNSALLSFIAWNDEFNFGFIAESGSIADSTTAGGGNDSEKEVAGILDDVQQGDDEDVDGFISHLGTLGTDEEVAAAVGTTLPSIAVSTPAVGVQVLNTMSSVVQARQASVRGFSSGDIAFSDKNMWFKPFAGYAKQNDKDGISGFDANIYGFGMGIDGEYKQNHRAGLAVFYTMAGVDLNDATQNSDIGVLNLIGYGSNPIIDDKSLLFYQVGFGLQNSETNRAVSGIGTAKADYDSKSFFVQLKATREFQLSGDTTLVPALKSTYKYFSNPSYSESGVGGMGLDVESFISKEFLLGFEGDLKHKVNDTTELLVNAGVYYDFENDAQIVSAGFQGTPGTVFTTNGIKNSAFTYEAGFGLAKKLDKNLMLDIKYDFSGRGSDFQNHALSAKFNYKF